MKIPPNESTRIALIAVFSFVVTILFLTRSILLFLPVFALMLYGLWRMGGGRLQKWEEDDPADWWKNGQRKDED
ncbi:MAG: hypothetical protein Q8R76_03790 [Candidatus Omnitrophota bacterium]|nr:hypothetical protein [Candidatus Omnitrophota bacterium]